MLCRTDDRKRRLLTKTDERRFAKGHLNLIPSSSLFRQSNHQPLFSTTKHSFHSVSNTSQAKQEKTGGRKYSEYFLDVSTRKKHSESRSSLWFGEQVKGTPPGQTEMASVYLRSRPAFWDNAQVATQENPFRWDTSRPASQASILKAISRRGKHSTSSLIDSPIANRSIQPLGDKSNNSLPKTQFSGSKKAKAVLNEMSGISPINHSQKIEKRALSELPFDFECRPVPTDSDYDSQTERLAEKMRIQMIESSHTRKEKTKSGTFGQTTLTKQSKGGIRVGSLHHQSNSHIGQSLREQCLLLGAANGVLKTWRSAFPELFAAVSESIGDSKTLKQRLASVQARLSGSASEKPGLVGELMRQEPNDASQLTALLTEHLCLLEHVQEAVENGVIKLQRDLQEDEFIDEFFRGRSEKTS